MQRNNAAALYFWYDYDDDDKKEKKTIYLEGYAVAQGTAGRRRNIMRYGAAQV